VALAHRLARFIFPGTTTPAPRRGRRSSGRGSPASLAVSCRPGASARCKLEAPSTARNTCIGMDLTGVVVDHEHRLARRSRRNSFSARRGAPDASPVPACRPRPVVLAEPAVLEALRLAQAGTPAKRGPGLRRGGGAPVSPRQSGHGR